MNRLKWMIGYLAGPMDHVPDGGKEWREHMEEFLRSVGCGVLNPCDKPTDVGSETPEERALRKKLMKDGAVFEKLGYRNKAQEVAEELHAIMRPIVAIDLRMVDIAHFTILYVDKDYHACGSYNEQTHACLQRKPVIVMCKQGKFGVPDWLWGICTPDLFFGSWGDVKDYLHYVNTADDVKHYNRWRFFDFDKIYGFKK